MRSWLLLALVGCAQAGAPAGLGIGNGRPDSGTPITLDGPPGGGIDAPSQSIDAPMVMIDAPHIDAAIDAPPGPQNATLDENTSNADAGYGVSCGVAADGYTVENTFYRAFRLSDFGISGTLHVTDVHFVTAEATNMPLIKISVGTYSGSYGANTLTTSSISLSASTTKTIGNVAYMSPENEDVAITADVTGVLLVEVEQTTVGNESNEVLYYIGANQAGETEPGYVSAVDTDCDITTPTNMSTVAGEEADPVIWVTGTY
jgi:hypothetical protein